MSSYYRSLVIGLLSLLFSAGIAGAQLDQKIPAKFQLNGPVRPSASGAASRGTRRTPVKTASAAIHPWIDDAHLWDVQFVGKAAGWAVGDHGTVWKTRDAGQTWQQIPVPTKGSLKAVRFLTTQFGWIVGHETQEYSRVGQGVILRTEDGGASWERIGQVLPPLNAVRLFGPDEVIVAGESSEDFPTGIATTSDAGETWQSAEGVRTEGWSDAYFSDVDEAVVVGTRSRVAMMAGNQLASPRVDPTGLRAIHGISMSGLTGWAVGDGALVMKTENGGVSWMPPGRSFPQPMKSLAEFYDVAARGTKVWIAGSPGSIIWHSSDGGATWQKQLTGQTQPIHGLHFASDTDGWAVGSLGLIIKTSDGGRTWHAVRGGGRRAAMLTIHTFEKQVPFGAISKFGGDQGFRIVSMLLAHQASHSKPARPMKLASRFHEAVTAVGGSRAISNWRLPITRPEVTRDMQAITAEWQRHTDNQLVETVMSHLVATIRTWKPSVILIDEPRPDVDVDQLIADAVQRAIREAADPTLHLKLQDLGGLDAWQVQKLFQRTPESTKGRIIVEPFDMLFGLKSTVDSQARLGRSLLFAGPDRDQPVESFNPIVDPSNDKFVLTAARDFWRELSIAHDSEARRPAIPFDEQQFEQQEQIARRQRNMRAIAAKLVADPSNGRQLIAHLQANVIKGLPRQQAAAQLVSLANEFRSQALWTQAESVMLELIQHYPDQPVTREAMVWLLHLWSSEEMAWHRSRQVNLTSMKQQTNRAEIERRMGQLIQASMSRQLDPLKVARELTYDPIAQLERTGEIPAQDAGQWRSATSNYWRDQGISMARLMQKRAPHLLSTQLVEWPLASLLRRQQHYRIAENVYRRRFSTSKLDPIARVAVGELWISHPTDDQPDYIAAANWATAPPHLDGVLGDGCWQATKELILHGDDPIESIGGGVGRSNKSAYPFVLLARDDKFLYLAASLPRSTEVTRAGAAYQSRKHDDDLTGFDRVAFSIDIDRDYTTSYQVEVDQRGHVSESCWEDATWNPKMFVAVNGDKTHWRLEAAIPFKELAPGTPTRGETWAISIQRTIPNTSWQSWVGDADGKLEPGNFGLLQFR